MPEIQNVTTMLRKSEPLRCIAHIYSPVVRLSATTDPLIPVNTKSEVFMNLTLAVFLQTCQQS
jgi:hypothetical protein